MSKESAQAALNKFAEAVNTGKFDLFDQVVAPNCVDHDPADGQVPGATGYRMFFSGMRTAFPDMNVAPRDHGARRGHHRLCLHPDRHAQRAPRKDPARLRRT